MFFHALTGLTAALSILGHVQADCYLENKKGADEGGIETRPELCTPQADGNYQLAMDTSESVFPTFNSEAMWAGLATQQAFILYASDCTVLAVYSPHQDNDCGIEYEVPFFQTNPNLKITSVNFDPADPFFAFEWLGESYSSGDAKCGGCGELSDSGDLHVEQGCKCGFYVADIDLEVPTAPPQGRAVAPEAFKA